MNGPLQYIRRVRASRRSGVVLAAAAAAAGLGGCGSDEQRESRPRPPAPINVTAAIASGEVRVSPRSFGSGPVVFLISNQSGVAQRLTFEGSIRRTSGTIAARGTGQLTADPPSGRYTMRASAGGLKAATVRVGEPRPSSQDRLLLP
jgi:hypothetical protein